MRTGLWCGVTRYCTVDPTLRRIYLSPQLPSYHNSGQCNINNKNMYFWYLVKSHSKNKQTSTAGLTAVYLRILVDKPPSYIRRNRITHHQLYYQPQVLLLVPSSFAIFVALSTAILFLVWGGRQCRRTGPSCSTSDSEDVSSASCCSKRVD
jgi:hypothetical protein